MSYIIQAVLSNAGHPEYGQVTVPFPIPSEEYDRNIELLSALGTGDAVNRDCKVDGLDSSYTVLKRMIGTVVTVDELDYLAKRLDSFSFGEDAQFQAMAVKLGISNITDFINLTFCCQQATVITDFSDLEQIGKNHYLTLNGGSASLEELEKINGRQTALALILNETGCVTPYGVVYDNGMELEPLYNGRQFPEYLYDEHLLVIKVESDGLPDDQQNPEYQRMLKTKGIRQSMNRQGNCLVNAVVKNFYGIVYFGITGYENGGCHHQWIRKVYCHRFMPALLQPRCCGYFHCRRCSFGAGFAGDQQTQ